jgi:hypothetical protein
VHKLLAEHYGDPHAAAIYLSQVLAAGKVHTIWRRLDNWRIIGRPPSDFWSHYKVACGPGGLQIVPRRVAAPAPPPGTVVIRSLALEARLAQRSSEERKPAPPLPEGVLFFAWPDDFPEFRPSIPANMQKPEPKIEPQPEMPPRRKPGPIPKHDWPLFVARELIRRAKAGEKDPTAIKMIELCAESDMDYSPPLRSMQELLKKLLG